MRGYTLCPVCAKHQLGVPLVDEDNSRVCPLCQSAFRMKCNLRTLK